MADERRCYAGDLGSWAIGRILTGIDRFGDPWRIEVADVTHRPSAYEGEFVTVVRMKQPLSPTVRHVVFPHETTVTVHANP